MEPMRVHLRQYKQLDVAPFNFSEVCKVLIFRDW